MQLGCLRGRNLWRLDNKLEAEPAAYVKRANALLV